MAVSLSAATRPLIGELALARRRTDHIFNLVPAEKLYERPIRERHRVAFYLGHLEAFDANLLLRERSLVERSANALDDLFAFGIDPVGGALPTDAPEDWPAIAAIRAYVEETRRRVDLRLMDTPDGEVAGVSMVTLLHAAIEHRLMHAETLAYMLNRLWIEKPSRTVTAPETRREFDDEDMVPVPAAVTILGVTAAHEGFVWDNEYQAHAVEVPAFDIDRYMVTNAQYLRFVQADGYSNPRWWKPEDWQWRSANGILNPASWQRVNDAWYLTSRVDLIALQGDWPVYVSHAEASAYASWAGKQLPTEAQWHRAAYGGHGTQVRYPWGDSAPSERHGNFDFSRWDPMPVDAHPCGNSAFGVAGLLGNGWEWTATPFAAFPDFQAFAFYPGYSADFFDGRHFVLKGGSAHTAARLLRRSFRNWFQPHYPFAYAGFRCVRVRA